MEKPSFRKYCDQYLFGLTLTFLLVFIVLVLVVSDGNRSFSFRVNIYQNPTPLSEPANVTADRGNAVPNESLPDPCSSRYIYVHDLPSLFNDDLLRNCKSLIKWVDMCPLIVNSGLGPKVDDPKGVLSDHGWYNTNQFLLGVIFPARMKQYKCLTNDSSLASAVFIPFYAGLEVGRHLWGFNILVRDSLAQDLVTLVRSRPEWSRMWGMDHFLIGGRTACDYRRQTDNDFDWGSKLMFLPGSNNMTLLSIESTMYLNDLAIPYPTYFHPTTRLEVSRWQERVRRQRREYLFAFVGAPRPQQKVSIRSQLISQCIEASNKTCNLLECYYNGHNRCEDPVEVIQMFKNSVFCLQPPGDTYTRRSTFDAILAGCIPVFFHPGSAYAQYTWHFPKDYRAYSVFIPKDDVKHRNASVNEVLSRVPMEKIQAMREEVIRMIPRIVYADPRSEVADFEDAFDVAVQGVLNRIEGVRRRMSQGEDPIVGFSAKDNERFNLSFIQ